MGSSQSKDDGSKLLIGTITEHQDSINCLTVAEDESLLVTGSEDRTARMYCYSDTDGAECIGTLSGHNGYVTSVAVFDTYVFTGSSDNMIRKWDMFECTCIYTYEGHTGSVMRVICTGDYVISSSKDHTAKIWTFETEDIRKDDHQQLCIRTLKGHTKTVHPLIFMPKGSGDNDMDWVITGSADNYAKLWDVDTGSCLVTYLGHRGAIMTMTTDSDEENKKVIFTGSVDKTIRSFIISTGRPMKVFEGHTAPIMCISVVNKLMYSGDSDGLAKGWAWQFGDCTCDYKGHKHSVTCLYFHKGILYTGCGDGVGRAFDAKTGILTGTYKPDEPDAVINCMLVCKDKLFTGSRDGKLRIWDIYKPEQ